MADQDSFQPDSFQADPKTEMSASGFGKNVLSSGENFLGGFAHAAWHPLDTAAALFHLGRGFLEKASDTPTGNILGRDHIKNVDAFIDMYKDRYGSWDNFKKTLYEDPVGAAADLATLASGSSALLKGSAVVADAAGASRLADAVTTAAKTAQVVSDVTDPMKVTGKVVGAIADKTGAGKIPEIMYRGALRRGYRAGSVTPAELAELARTGLEAGLPVSPEGVDRIHQAILDLNQAITNRVGSAPGGMTIDRNAVLARLDPVEKRFGMQVAPERDLRDINRVGDEFVRTNSPQITLADAQAKKVGTYQQIQGQYGKLSTAEIEAQKALAMGLKEELVKAIPELGDLNDKEGKFLQLQKVLETAVNKSVGHNGGISPWITGGTVGAATKDIRAGLVVGLIKDVLADPNLRSRLAIKLSRAAGKSAPLAPATAYERIDAYRDHLDRFQKDQQSFQQQ